MAKRFTDTEKWDRPWFRALHNQYKLLWCFVLDKCDIAGIWYVDLEMASFQIGARFDRQKTEEAFRKQIEVSGERWLLKDFVAFQYGSLEASNKIYKNVTVKLNGFKDGASMPHPSPIDGVMVMVKEKDKDKDSSLSLERHGKPFFNLPDDLKENEAEILDWLEYKRQRGQSYKPKGLEALWRTIRLIPKEQRRASVDQSMANNWAGLFERRGEHGNWKIDGRGAAKAGKLEPSKFDSITETI